MLITKAEERLRAIADSNEDVQAIDTLLNEIDRLKEDVRIADGAYKFECRKRQETERLLYALMKYMVGGGDDAQEM